MPARASSGSARRSTDRAVGDLVNLKAARKASAKAAAKAVAAANRAAFGRPKSVRTADSEAEAARNRRLDQARREP
jgi:hypothetical protein